MTQEESAKSEKPEKDSQPSKKAKGRKGGAQFPHIDLEKALAYAKKLVSKTHNGPLPASSIFAGVFGASHGRGQVRAAAMKQYGLLEGLPSAYKASSLAIAIDAAPLEEQSGLAQQALLKPKVFRQIYETFQNDTTSKARIEQRVKGLKVHPESASECTNLFIASALAAQVASMDGDSVTIKSAANSTPSEASDDEDQNGHVEDGAQAGADEEEAIGENSEGKATERTEGPSTPKRQQKGSQATVNLNLSVDSTTDPDKLEKQLSLLKKFGML